MTKINTSTLLSAINEASAANSALSQKFAREQMKFNAEQAAIDRAWQENMANTAHQREVKDLLAAGLNPILSTGGNGAATPSGAQASGASGAVDTSYAHALSSYATSLISSAASIKTAQISAAASKYGTDKAYTGQIINSGSQLVNSIMNLVGGYVGMKALKMNQKNNYYLTGNSAK